MPPDKNDRKNSLTWLFISLATAAIAQGVLLFP